VKLAHVVARFLASQGLRHVFGVSGGASLHLIHGICDETTIQFIPTAHEQGAAFAADAYARVSGLGCALATSGPGATNLITGIAASFYDSTQVLYLTGNVATFRFGAPLGVRQYGFQETPICDIVRKITKYAVTVMDPNDILYELEKALWLAKASRKGPVLVDIPDDIQRAEVDPAALRHYSLPIYTSGGFIDARGVATMLQDARRPIMVWGSGIRPYAQGAILLARSLGIPVATTWGAIDLLNADDPLMAGGFGTHGNRGANFAVQNADLVISIGSRLDTKATGFPKHFARGAKLVMVDIDPAEIAKFDKLGRKVDLGICADAGAFIEAMHLSAPHDWVAWRTQVQYWKARYPSVDDPAWTGTKPYELVRKLAEETTPDDIIVSDTGTALGYLMQAFPFKGERFIHAFNSTPMGYGIPAAIGAAFASGRRVVLVTGDGSALMSTGELATLSRHQLPIRILLLNNLGHAMCRQTQRQWLGGNYPGTSIAGGLGFPDFENLALAFGIPIDLSLETLFGGITLPDGKPYAGPCFMEAMIDPDAQLIPQAKFGQPLEDADPPLPREEFRRQMVVEPVA
jgi:acetolactate synthase-1/2/3 large subunit